MSRHNEIHSAANGQQSRRKMEGSADGGGCSRIDVASNLFDLLQLGTHWKPLYWPPHCSPNATHTHTEKHIHRDAGL